MAAEDRITIRADACQWEAIMLTGSGTRHSFSSIVAVRWIAAAIVLTIPIQPSYAATDVFTASRTSGKIDSGTLVVDLLVPEGKYAIFAKINLDQDDTNSF